MNKITRKILYLANFIVIVFCGAMIGILNQDKIIQSTIPTPTVTATPVPSKAPSPTPTRKPSPTVIPTPRPTDKIVDDKYKQYSNKDAGIEFKYKKEWDLFESVRSFNPLTEAPSTWLRLSSSAKEQEYVIVRNPYEYHAVDKTIKEEPVTIDGYEGTLVVGMNCKLGSSAKCNEDVSFENNNYIQGHIVISLNNVGKDSWIFDGPFWTPENPLTVDEAIRQAKELVNSVHFIKR